MNIRVKNVFESFRSFLNGPGKYTLFTSLFYSLCLMRIFLLSQNFDLHHLSGRMLGIATLENYDVGARVALFYKCVLLLFLAFPAITMLAMYLYKKAPALFYSTEARIANYSALAGIFFLLLDASGLKVPNSLELVYFMHKLVIAGLILHRLFRHSFVLTAQHYAFGLVLSFSLFFFVSGILSGFGFQTYPDFLITTFILCCLFLSTILFMYQRHPIPETAVTKLVYVLAPLAALPLVNVISDELFFILKNRGISLNGSVLPFYIFSLLLALFCWIRSRLPGRAESQKRLLAYSYFPLFIFSWISYTFYSYYFKHTGEVFEAANKYLAIMELDHFGVIPTVEKFNSHLLSDYFFSGLYTLLNGLQGNEMELYDFLNTSFSYLLYYYLVLYITRNAYVAAFLILLFPLTQAFLPEPYAFAVLGIFALHRILTRPQNTKSYLIFFGILAFLVFWRIDLGYACFVVMPLLLLFYHFFVSDFRIKWKPLLLALSILAGAAIALISALSLYRHINLFSRFNYALNYLSSAQTYGYSTLGDSRQIPYSAHYYVFPVIAALLIILLLFKYRELNKSRGQRLAYLSFLFICGFYFLNFNRGLVRHSLIEWIDHFTSTFIYAILAGSIFVFYYYKPQHIRLMLFFGLVFITLTNYKLPRPLEARSMAEIGVDKVDHYKKTDLARIESRVTHLPEKKDDPNQPFIEFMAKTTTAGETFIDFSNNPMLYFYTHKITPSYFYQNPACSHNDFLQNRFIADLKDYSTPFLLFSRKDYEGRDYLDDVPNTLRHYRMAEYFYQNYSPFAIVGDLRIWKNNEHPAKNARRILHAAKKGPGQSIDTLLHTRIHLKNEKKYVVYVRVSAKNACALKATFQEGYDWPKMEYVNDDEAYCVLPAKSKNMELHFEGDIRSITELQVMECDFVPDFFAESFLTLDFMKLPYVWGKYDKKLKKENVIFNQQVSDTLTLYKKYAFDLPSRLDRSSGNTLIFHCRNTSGAVQKVELSLGKTHDARRSRVSFDVLPSGKFEPYAIRISSIHKWYTDKPTSATLTTESEGIQLAGIKLTKGL